MNIYVSNLNSGILCKHLTDPFSPYGNVSSAEIYAGRVYRCIKRFCHDKQALQGFQKISVLKWLHKSPASD